MSVKYIDLICFSVFILSVICGTLGDCEPGWVRYGPQCYSIMSRNRYNLQDSLAFCSRRNAKLWIYHSEEERTWMSQLLAEGPRIMYWVGLSVVDNRRWEWLDGSAYDKNTLPWYQGIEGNLTIDRPCAVMFAYPPNTGMVQQKRCNEGWGTVCMKQADGVLDYCDSADGWQHLDDRCLKAFDTPMTWPDARSTCQQHGGDLTIFKDYVEQRDFDSLVTCRTSDEMYWIGLSDTVTPDTWRWINNDTVRYSRWVSYHNQLIDHGQTCAAASAVDGWAWRHYLCDTRLKFVCNRTLGVCPSGWLQHLDRCYEANVVSDYQKTWFDAKTYCESLGASLIQINSRDEQGFINETLNSLKITRAWLGFSDWKNSDNLEWLDGSNVFTLANYINFDASDSHSLVPNRYDCGIINTSPIDSLWATGYCFNNNAFFCESKITNTPVSPTPTTATFQCQPDWVLFRDHCYYFGPVGNQSTKIWDNARDYCAASGGNLVIIEEPFEMSFVTVQQAGTVNAWIGMKYDVIAKKLLWVDGTAPGEHWAQETNFYPGEPDDTDNGQLCIQIIGGRQEYTGSWDDANCTNSQGFICEKDATTTFVASTTQPTVPVWSAACGEFGWTYNSNDNLCYQVVLNQPKIWEDARLDCIQRGGDLVSIPSTREQNFIQAMLSTGQYASMQLNYWIGATNDRLRGWHWTDNAPFRYLHWYPGEPNNHGLGGIEENCAEIIPAWAYQWNDKKCDKEQNYICRKTGTLPTASTIFPPAQDLTAKCDGEPLISGNFSIVDKSAFSSSSASSSSSGPEYSRLVTETDTQFDASGGWSAQTSDPSQYIAVQFYGNVVVKGIQTAGRTDNDQWVKEYKIQYQESYYSKWLTYQDPPGIDKVFTGNTDAVHVVTNKLLFPFEAKLVKLIPVHWNYAISLRWEILGCKQETCDADYAISGPLVVEDSQLVASTEQAIAHDAKASRIRPITLGVLPSCWIPQTMDRQQYVQATFSSMVIVKGVTTKGNPNAEEWVTKYKFSYISSAQTDYSQNYYVEPYNIVKIIDGNVDNTSPSTFYFKSNFKAKSVRIYPVEWHNKIALAFDVLVCQDGCEGKALISGKMHVSDDSLTASSSLDPLHGMFRSRLNSPANDIYAGAWMPRYNDEQQYIQVDLLYGVHIKAVATQGAADSQDWVEDYLLSYSSDGASWVSYFATGNKPNVFKGNWENTIVRKHYMKIPFIARYVRLWPKTWHNRIALRWELYGCPGADSGLQIGCYSDDVHDRDLPYEPFTDPRVGMWPPMCIDHCFRQGYHYAGLQGQFKCFCGDSYGRYGPDSNCTLQCMPKSNFYCGGPSASIIYTTGLTPQFKVCPNKWKAYGDMCYILLQDQRSWLDARSNCKRVGADLASPNNQAQQDFIYSLLQFSYNESVWIGLNDRVDESVFNWADGRQVRYTNWDFNQPSHILNADQDCTLMQPQTGAWQDAACKMPHMYLCQMDKRPSSEPQAQGPVTVDGCPPGWQGYRWSCYLYSDASRTWDNSRAVCRSFGAELVRIDDRFENAYIASVLATRTGRYFTDITSVLDTQDIEGPSYLHTTLGASLTFTNWAAGEPANSTGLMVLGSGNVTGLWYTVAASSRLGVICERTRAGYTTPTTTIGTTPAGQCATGLIQTTNFCYQVNIVADRYKKTWAGARDDCVAKGGNLASFHNSEEVSAIWRQGFVGQGSEHLWIGLRLHPDGGAYFWADSNGGQSQAMTVPMNWADGEPNNYNGHEECVELRSSSGKWNDESCSSRRNWICGISRQQASFNMVTTQLPPTAGNPALCGIPGWSYYNGSCYYVDAGSGDNASTWRQARGKCQQHGADLAAILSQQEQDFVYLTMCRDVATGTLWLGFSELSGVGGYTWSDQSPVVYTNWGINEPNDYYGAEDCVSLQTRDGKWNDAYCGRTYGYICKFTVGASPSPPAPTSPWSGNCESGFRMFNNRCYRIYTDMVSWNTAQGHCRDLGPGYRLASIRNDVENAFILTLMADITDPNPWIGLKKDDGGRFLWMNNDEVTYTNFARTEPNGGQKERCVQMLSLQNKVGQWNDNRCTATAQYVCMTSKKASLTTTEAIPSICDTKQGQTQFLTSCYFYVPDTLTWADANQRCIASGGYLTSINSEYEQAHIYVTMSQYYALDGIWSGLSDATQAGRYTWVDGWPVVYSNWDDGQPGNTQGCVMLNTTGKWNVVNCNSTYPAVCKISTAVPSLTPPPPHGLCGQDWYPYNGKCYNFALSRPMSVLDATMYCQHMQSQLVSIHNQTVGDWLVRTVTALSTRISTFWTGLHKSLDSGFQWQDGTPVQYTNWRSGEPSLQGWAGRIENCMELIVSGGKWNDESCDSKRAFICEKQMAVDSSGEHFGTGVMPVRTPTPYPLTQPSILPPQEVPTLHRKHTTRPPTTRVAVVTNHDPHTQAPPLTPRITQATRSPPKVTQARQVTKHTTMKQTAGFDVRTNPPRQTSTTKLGNGVTEASKSNDGPGGLSGGGIAGVIIGVVGVVLIGIMGVVIWRRVNMRNNHALSRIDNLGFENNGYGYDTHNDGSFESPNGMSLKTIGDSGS